MALFPGDDELLDPVWPPPHWQLGPDGAPVIGAPADVPAVPDPAATGTPDAAITAAPVDAGTPPPPFAPPVHDMPTFPWEQPAATPTPELAPEAKQAPAPELQPDAISGGADRHDDYLATLGEGATIRTEGSPEQERARSFAQGTPEERAKALGQMSLDEQAGVVPHMTDEEFVNYTANREQALKSNRAALEAKAALDAEQQAADELEAHRRAVEKTLADKAKLAAEAQELSKSNGFDKSFGGVVLAAVASALGGWASPATGGRNLALEAIQKAAEAHLANQWKSLEMRQGQLADRAAVEQDMYREKQKLVIAGYTRMEADIATKMQQFDPRGQIASDARAQLAQVQAAKAKALADYEQNRFKNNLDVAKYDLDVDKQNFEREKFNAQQRKAAGVGGAGATGVLQKGAYTRTQLAQLYPNQPLPPDRPEGWTPKDYKAWLETQASGEELKTKQRTNDPNERNRELGIGEITYTDGSPVQFRSDTFAGKLADTKGDVDEAVRLIDELVKIRNRSGWESDWVKSPDWRRAQAAFASLLIKAKNSDQLGVLSGSDLDLIAKQLGTKDPTEVRDSVVPGLLAARDNMINDVNAKIRAQAVPRPGQAVKRWEPPNLQHIEEAKPLVQGKTAVEKGEGAKLGKIGEHLSFTTNEDRARAAENAAAAGPTGLDPDDDKRVVEAVNTAATGKPASQENAVQRLADVINKGTESVRYGVLGRVYEQPDVLKRVLPLLDPAIAKEVQRLNPGHVFRPPAPGEKLLDLPPSGGAK